MSDALLDEIPEDLHSKVLTALAAETSKLVHIHPVEIRLEFDDINSDVIQEIQDRLTEFKYQEDEIVRSYQRVIDVPNLRWTDVILPQFRLTMRSKQTGYCTSMYSVSDFEYTKECKSRITLKDLAELTYRMKSTKCGHNIELVDHVEIEQKNDITAQLLIHFQYSHNKTKTRPRKKQR